MRASLCLLLLLAVITASGCRLPPTPAVFRDDFCSGLVTPDTNIGDDLKWQKEQLQNSKK